MEILNKSEHRAIGGGGGLKIGKNSERNLWMAPYRILGRVPKQQNNNAALHDVAHNLKGACIISALCSSVHNAAQSFLSF